MSSLAVQRRITELLPFAFRPILSDEKRRHKINPRNEFI